jgi:glyoxylase-like metal-dependent hydrolase (beta-lactamase superfamily II)
MPWSQKMGLKIGIHAKYDEANKLPSALKRLGLAVDDIDIVVNSHFDSEHCGGNKFLKNATFIAQRECLDFAYNRPKKMPWGLYYYRRKDFDLDVNYEGITGDYEVVKDVFAISTPGHTKGHQSLMVRLDKSGTIIFAGDVFYLRESLSDDILPPFWAMLSTYEFWESRRKLRDLARMEKAKVVVAHDPDQYEEEIKAKSPFA